MAENHGAENQGCGGGRRAPSRKHTNRHHEHLLRNPVPDHPDQGRECNGKEERVWLEPGNEFGEVRHNAIEYTR